mgnify:CR=1 FL=1
MHYDEQRKADQYRMPKFSSGDDLHIAINYNNLTPDEMALFLSRTSYQIKARIDELKKLELI